MSTLKVDTIKSADGTYEFGRCLSWVRFNGTGTVAINSALNVSSITDNATGDYTINFTQTMPDENYAYALCGDSFTQGTSNGVTYEKKQGAMAAGSFNFYVAVAGSTTAVDTDYLSAVFFR